MQIFACASLFQIVSEHLFNVVKHTGVNYATVSRSSTDGSIQVEVSDSGRGFNVEGTPSRSRGIPQNQQQLELMGGRMQIESDPQMGTRIVIECPIPDRMAQGSHQDISPAA